MAPQLGLRGTTPEVSRDEHPDLFLAQGLEDDPLDHIVVDPAQERFTGRVACRVVPGGGREDQGTARDGAAQLVEDRRAARVEPLDVVDEQDEQAELAGHGGEEVGGGMEKPGFLVPRRERGQIRRLSDELGDAGSEAREQGPVTFGGTLRRIDDPVALALRDEERRGHEMIERLSYRCERRVPSRLRLAADDHRTIASSLAEELAQQARLSAAGLAFDLDQGASSPLRLRPGLPQHRHLGAAADERHLPHPGSHVEATQGERAVGGPLEVSEAVEVGGEPLRGLVAVIGILRQELVDDGREHRTDCRPEVVGVGRGLGEMLPHQLADVVGLEGGAPGRAVKQEPTEGIEVAPTVDRPFQHAGLLGGCVDDGPERALLCPLREHVARKPEVDDLRPSGRMPDHVGGLDVAMDEPPVMHLGEGPRELLREPDDIGLGHGAAGDGSVEGLTLRELHHEVRLLVQLPELHDLHQAVVIQASHRGGLPAQPQVSSGVAVGRAQHLDRVRHALPGRSIHDASGALTQQLERFVPLEFRILLASLASRRAHWRSDSACAGHYNARESLVARSYRDFP